MSWRRWRPSGPARRARPEPVALEERIPGAARCRPARALPSCGWPSAESCLAMRGGSARRSRCSSRAGTPPARAGRSSGWSQPLDPAPRAGGQSYAAPTPDEKRHHFLWRFWPALPGLGRHDRLRPLLVRPRARRARRGLRDPARSGARLRRDRRVRAHALRRERRVLVKFWLHISDEEQLNRFEKREKNPLKSWKITDEDWRNREKRAAVRAGGRGHARAHRPRARARGSSWRPTTSATRA